MLKRVVYGQITLLFIFMLWLFSCTKKEVDSEKTSTLPTKAVAEMSPTAGHQAKGTVTFTKEETGIRVVAHFEGVSEGEHGFHIHEFGDCSSGDGKSAGGHFNPESMPHAGPMADQRHVGDLGNITADASGIARKEFIDSRLTFEGVNSIIGKGVILHADPDDLSSQPTGAAGARIACGIIEGK